MKHKPFMREVFAVILAAGVGLMSKMAIPYWLLIAVTCIAVSVLSVSAQENNSENVENSETADIDDIKPPEILYDPDKLTFPARRMRELLLEAANSGDMEKLRPYIGIGNDMTTLSFGGVEGDPIEFLKTQSGDPEGHETLAILAEVLESGFVRLDPDTENEMFVWPYFYSWPLQELTPKQRVELFRIVTHGDYQDMEDFGAYIFYRVGITPSGRWRFFVAGD